MAIGVTEAKEEEEAIEAKEEATEVIEEEEIIEVEEQTIEAEKEIEIGLIINQIIIKVTLGLKKRK